MCSQAFASERWQWARWPEGLQGSARFMVGQCMMRMLDLCTEVAQMTLQATVCHVACRSGLVNWVA